MVIFKTSVGKRRSGCANECLRSLVSGDGDTELLVLGAQKIVGLPTMLPTRAYTCYACLRLHSHACARVRQPALAVLPLLH